MDTYGKIKELEKRIEALEKKDCCKEAPAPEPKKKATK